MKDSRGKHGIGHREKRHVLFLPRPIPDGVGQKCRFMGLLANQLANKKAW